SAQAAVSNTKQNSGAYLISTGVSRWGVTVERRKVEARMVSLLCSFLAQIDFGSMAVGISAAPQQDRRGQGVRNDRAWRAMRQALQAVAAKPAIGGAPRAP